MIKKVFLSIVVIQILLTMVIGFSGKSIACSGVHCQIQAPSDGDVPEKRVLCNKASVSDGMGGGFSGCPGSLVKWSCKPGKLEKLRGVYVYYNYLPGIRHYAHVTNITTDGKGNFQGYICPIDPFMPIGKPVKYTGVELVVEFFEGDGVVRDSVRMNAFNFTYQ